MTDQKTTEEQRAEALAIAAEAWADEVPTEAAILPVIQARDTAIRERDAARRVPSEAYTQDLEIMRAFEAGRAEERDQALVAGQFIPAPVIWALRFIGMPEHVSPLDAISQWIVGLPAMLKAEGAREEREAVVRFLLERVAFRASGIPTHENIAQKIERGEHRKRGEKS